MIFSRYWYKTSTAVLATVTGTYKNGQIILDEDLPVTSKTAKVIMTVAEEVVEKQEKPSEAALTGLSKYSPFR